MSNLSHGIRSAIKRLETEGSVLALRTGPAGGRS